MAVCYTGSKSQTKSELRGLLCLDSFKSDCDDELFKQIEIFRSEIGQNQESLKIGNALFLKNGYEINSEYRDLVTRLFQTSIEFVDFKDGSSAARVINKWVNEKSNGKISEALSSDSVDELTRMIVVNVVYFKESWMYQFEKEKTYKCSFKLIDGSEKRVDMMSLRGKKFRILENPAGLEASVCELPYKGKTLSMSIILPDLNSSLDKVEKSLDSRILTEILNQKGELFETNLDLPKFKSKFTAEMTKDFKELGGELAFGNKADFSGINLKKDLFISQIVHQVFIDVNEEGTEAAAATVVRMRKKIRKNFTKNFICDRPFLFLIHENSLKLVIFMGKISDPSTD